MLVIICYVFLKRKSVIYLHPCDILFGKTKPFARQGQMGFDISIILCGTRSKVLIIFVAWVNVHFHLFYCTLKLAKNTELQLISWES